MKITNLTWLGLLMTLSSFSVTTKTLAVNPEVNKATENVDSRLNRISEALKAREKELPEDSDLKASTEEILISLGWGNGRQGTFVNVNRPNNFWNNRGGGGFLNNRGGGGFINQPRNFWNNRGWGDGGGFWNRR
ncbi:GrrA/OscA1 family cyclophane-containing rSAM-modified RiPP [Geminocystis sp. CENA526]|uniref:GrrA/OscA1 family cyclophane-containing rSAM-modified RiPP n=1 Tax=Geminocystis sp. CENA526 TaxID=1355871 RepID=UPI003D6E7A9D